jgi:hypothetical protein
MQPVGERGIVLVGPDGRGARRICTTGCGTPVRPRWSPDGRALVFASPSIRIVYTDGSCLNCTFGAAPNPAFEPGGTLISFLQNHRLTVDGIDGLRKAAPTPGAAMDAVWSSTGRLATVRGGEVFAGLEGRRPALVGAGVEPSWSPDGRSIAVSRDGWVVVYRVGRRGGGGRRVAKGTAPAFSPDGRWIAYLGADARLMLAHASGRASPRAVGRVRGRSVDWQPLPGGLNPGCAAPPGSTVLAASADAIVTGDGLPQPPLGFSGGPGIAYMGCVRADGRERLLESFYYNNLDSAYTIGRVVLAAPYAGLVEDFMDEHYGDQDSTVQVFDLRTGALQPNLGGERGYVDPDQLVLGSDGVSAAHFIQVDRLGSLDPPLEAVACAPDGSRCVMLDGVGGKALDSQDPAGGSSAWSATGVGLLQGVACPSASLCVAVAASNVYTSSGPGAPWVAAQLGSGLTLTGVTCSSIAFCIGWGLTGKVATSTNPAGGPSAWSVTAIPGSTNLSGISCPSASRCVASDYRDHVFVWNGGSWIPGTSLPGYATGLTCPTASLCLAVLRNQPGILSTTDPVGGPWSATSLPGLGPGSVACPSAALCVAAGASGVAISTDPASGAWAQTPVDSGRGLDSIACSSASLCVAGDSAGHVVTSTDPTGGASTWTVAFVDGDPCTAETSCSIEQIQTSDATGLHTVDTAKLPGNGPFLTGLALTGDVLSWSHDGTAMGLTLQPGAGPRARDTGHR